MHMMKEEEPHVKNKKRMRDIHCSVNGGNQSTHQVFPIRKPNAWDHQQSSMSLKKGNSQVETQPIFEPRTIGNKLI